MIRPWEFPKTRTRSQAGTDEEASLAVAGDAGLRASTPAPISVESVEKTIVPFLS